eukprot:TRINITY_DN11896_c0_g1_i1.p1 TRINITY_DN11896_c0_g1~~TRINITY_DN11896_c0_g1_i1.p1  ORF type:complete len:174 (+),score=15.14 TRINITY_DN11896_c0_g1_i1:480-1001(+)
MIYKIQSLVPNLTLIKCYGSLEVRVAPGIGELIEQEEVRIPFTKVEAERSAINASGLSNFYLQARPPAGSGTVYFKLRSLTMEKPTIGNEFLIISFDAKDGQTNQYKLSLSEHSTLLTARRMTLYVSGSQEKLQILTRCGDLSDKPVTSNPAQLTPEFKICLLYTSPSPRDQA